MKQACVHFGGQSDHQEKQLIFESHFEVVKYPNILSPFVSSLSFLALSFCHPITLKSSCPLTLVSLSPSPLTPGCFGGMLQMQGRASGSHSGLLGAVMGGHAGQHTTAVTDPLCW